MDRILSVFFFLLIGPAVAGPDFILVKSIPILSNTFCTDNLGNLYLVHGNVLEKYDSKGNLIKTYSNKGLGDISEADVSNPMKILLFYAPFQQIVVLDNMLAPSDPILLQPLGFYQVSLICSSDNNGLWIYDRQNFNLVRFDQNFQPVSKTENITQQVLSGVHPDFLLERNNKVFLNDPEKGILVFDIYGTYYKTIPLTGLHSFQVSNEEIIYYKEKRLRSYHMKTLQETEMQLPDSAAYGARTEKENLYLLKQKSLDIYHVKNEK